MRITDFIRTAGRAFALLAFITSAASAQVTVQATMSSRFLARGETASLDIAILNGMPRLERSPVVPQVEDVKIEAGQPGPRMISARRTGYVFPFEVSSYKEGRHVIPSITLQLDGRTYTTPPQEFTVFNPDELQWSEATVGDQKLKYSASFHPLKDNPYEGETVPVEIKLYIPQNIPVEDWGIPEFERDGIACWRFEPSESLGQTNVLGRPYVSLAYPSSMSATRSGTVTIGPANLRLMLRTVTNDPFPRMSATPVFLAIPKRDIQAKKLPEGAPAGFVNAVGSFTMSSHTAQTELREGDPLSVDVTVTGTGNLDGMSAPKPKDADGWKIYEASAEQRGDERRQETGTVTFHQFMRPLGDKASVPAFQLVYFDPQLAQYKTIETPPIPLKLLPSLKEKPLAAAPAAIPPAAGIPVEKMNDILGLVQPARVVLPGATRLPSWTWQAVLGLVALLLVIKAVWMRVGPKLRTEPEVAARRQAFRSLERTASGDHPSFLRDAGRYIEQWLPKAATQDSSLHAILEERDATCYRGEADAGGKGDRSRRNAILKVIRKAAWLWIAVAWFGFTGESKASGDQQLQASAVEAYDAAEYEKAIQMWLDAGPFDRLSADTLYNIGNACYRLVPGHAALYYRRALERDSSHAEALQNLRFIERKYGSVSVKWADYQYALARFQLQTWRNMLWGGVWLVALGILICFATRAGSKARIPAVIGLILGPMIAAVGALGSHYYPDDSRFAPTARQAVVVGEKATLHAEASRTSQEVIDAPAGSLCEILKDRGNWLYVSFATKTRGWIPVEEVEKVLPDKKPEAPKLHKPDADSRST